jgi:hypothetical protein
VVTGGILLLTYKRPGKEPAPAKTGLLEVVPSVGPTGGAVIAVGRF